MHVVEANASLPRSVHQIDKLRSPDRHAVNPPHAPQWDR